MNIYARLMIIILKSNDFRFLISIIFDDKHQKKLKKRNISVNVSCCKFYKIKNFKFRRLKQIGKRNH